MELSIVGKQDTIVKMLSKWREEIGNKLTSEIPDKKEEEIKQKVSESQRPYCISENGIGYLKFGKHSEKIKIGKVKTQPFKLLQSLTEPFGTAKLVEGVFEAIRENIKKKSKSGTYTSEIDTNKKIQLIEYAIKELQKGNKLKGKLEFKWDDLKTKLWLEYIT